LDQWWTKSGKKNSNSPHLDIDLVAGYDIVIQNRIAQLLDSDDEFRAQCQTLLDKETIEIEIDVGLEYTSFVRTFFLPETCLIAFRMSDMSTKQLLSLMYFAGYLTIEVTSQAS